MRRDVASVLRFFFCSHSAIGPDARGTRATPPRQEGAPNLRQDGVTPLSVSPARVATEHVVWETCKKYAKPCSIHISGLYAPVRAHAPTAYTVYRRPPPAPHTPIPRGPPPL